jgi:hypothetical protein
MAADKSIEELHLGFAQEWGYIHRAATVTGFTMARDLTTTPARTADLERAYFPPIIDLLSWHCCAYRDVQHGNCAHGPTT